MQQMRVVVHDRNCKRAFSIARLSSHIRMNIAAARLGNCGIPLGIILSFEFIEYIRGNGAFFTYSWPHTVKYNLDDRTNNYWTY